MFFFFFTEEQLKEDPQRKELVKYVEENCYSQLDEDEYKKAELEWKDFPEESEEAKKLSLMRKQHTRKKHDEKVHKDFLRRQAKSEKKINRSYSEPITSSFMTSATSLELDNYLKEEKRPSFNDVFEMLRRKNDAGDDAEICRRGNLCEHTLSKIKNKTHKTVKRDNLWSISIGLKCSLDQAEELFESCGHTIGGGYFQTQEEEIRDRTIEFFVVRKASVKEINEVLYMKKLPELGNYSKE